MADLLDSTARHLRRTALARQRDGRLPGLYAGVCRGGELVWGDGIGVAELGTDRAPTADDQFLVASNTKTFIAVMVMQLRDEGRLTLDDLLGDHVPEVSHPITIRQCLAHVSGMAREPLGDVWETLEKPDAKTLRRDFDDVERIGRPARPLALLQRRLRDARPAGRGARRPGVGGVAAGTPAGPARDAAHDHRLRRRPPRHRLLRPAVRRRAAPRAGDGPQGDGARAAGWPAPRTTWRSGRRSSPTPARCSRPTRSRRCASRRSCSTPTSGTARWAWASS